MQGLASLKLDKILFRSLATINARYKAFSKEQADYRITKGDNVKVKDIFYFLQKDKDLKTKQGFTINELIIEVSLLILRDKAYFLT